MGEKPRRKPNSKSFLDDDKPRNKLTSIKSPRDRDRDRSKTPDNSRGATRPRSVSPGGGLGGSSDHDCGAAGGILKCNSTDTRMILGSGEKKKKKNGFKQKITRSISLDFASSKSDHGDYLGASLSTLFQVTFPDTKDELVSIREFERNEDVEGISKGDLWYFAKEMKFLLAQEVDWNRKYVDCDLTPEDIDNICASVPGAETADTVDLEELCCWRGLEHVFQGEERTAKIRHVTGGIVGWFQDAFEMGYHDPDELRIVSKARTKADRTKAAKMGAMDAAYVKKQQKSDGVGVSGGKKNYSEKQSTSDISPTRTKRMKKRLSGTFSALPKLNWSPKPTKKTAAVITA